MEARGGSWGAGGCPQRTSPPGTFQQCSAYLERSDTCFHIDVGFWVAASAFGRQWRVPAGLRKCRLVWDLTEGLPEEKAATGGG